VWSFANLTSLFGMGFFELLSCIVIVLSILNVSDTMALRALGLYLKNRGSGSRGWLQTYGINCRCQPTTGDPPAWEKEEGLTSHFKKVRVKRCYEMLHRASELADSYKDGSEPSGFVKGRKISWLFDWLLASQERLCSMELLCLLSAVAYKKCRCM
jgi:hypothetical protein